MARKHLSKYVKYYKYGSENIQLCTIGDVENAASSIKGGRMKNTRKYRNTKLHKRTMKFTM